MDYTTVSRFG